MKIESRARASIERRALTDEEKSSGYIGVVRGTIPYNTDSEQMLKRGRSRPFIETIAPGAFDKSIAEDTHIVAIAGHTEDPLSVFARIGENLTVKSDERALSYEALLPDTKASSDLLQLVEKRIIRGTSFEFIVRGGGGEVWEVGKAEVDRRTVTDARLFAFTPVIWPAYKDAELTIEYRSLPRLDELAALLELGGSELREALREMLPESVAPGDSGPSTGPTYFPALRLVSP